MNLLEDWIENRDDATFVSRFDKVALGWETEIDKKDGYSSMIYNFDNRTAIEIIRQAYNIGKTRLDSMGLFKNSLTLDPRKNCTDGKTIWASTEIFDKTGLSIGQKVDVFLGEIVHEAAHILYTDFKFLEKLDGNPIKKALLNIIEDEYIERSIGKEFPGYSNYIAAIKAELLGEPIGRSEDDITEIVNLVLKFIRYPKGIAPELIDKHEPLLIGIKTLFNTSYPTNSQECFDRMEELYEIIEDYYEKPPEKDDDEEEGEGEEGEGEEGEGEEGEGEEGGGEEGKGEGSGEGKDSGKESAKKGKSPDKSDGEGKEASEEHNPGDSNRDLMKDSVTISEEWLKRLDSAGDKTSTKDRKNSHKIDSSEIQDIEGVIEIGKGSTIYVPVKEGDKHHYEAVKKKVKSSIATLSRQLNFDTYAKTQVLRGMRNGAMDTSRLVEGSMNVPSIYTKTTKEKVKGGVIGILIDESGSMSCGTSYNGMSRAQVVQELAILINEAVAKTKLECYIYGHTADGFYGTGTLPNISTALRDPTFITVYKEKNKAIHKHSLSNVNSRYNNRDGVAIEETIKRIRKQTKDHIYLMVLSDGQPAASGGWGGHSGVQKTKVKVLEAQRKHNCTIIGVGIEVDFHLSTMYDHYVNFNNMNTFVKDTGKLLRGIIKKNYK